MMLVRHFRPHRLVESTETGGRPLDMSAWPAFDLIDSWRVLKLADPLIAIAGLGFRPHRLVESTETGGRPLDMSAWPAFDLIDSWRVLKLAVPLIAIAGLGFRPH